MIYDVVIFRKLPTGEDVVLDTRVSGDSTEQAAMKAAFQFISTQMAGKAFPAGDAAAEIQAREILAAYAELREGLDIIVRPFAVEESKVYHGDNTLKAQPIYSNFATTIDYRPSRGEIAR